MARDRKQPDGRYYGRILTADVNRKGVLDVDVVKGCTAGMAARPAAGCYDACYAAKIAKFRGIDFSKSITRRVISKSHAVAIERQVKRAPYGFFRVGTMGDPCHDWEEAVRTIEWLSEFARPVLITKHWRVATDNQLRRLRDHGTALNTSVSALDTPSELRHRLEQLRRFTACGGTSVARIVSCEFDRATEEGARLADIQDYLFSLHPFVDNPLRVGSDHALVVRGIIKTTTVRDLTSPRTVSLNNRDTYLGHCSGCPDLCGLSTAVTAPRESRQQVLWGSTE